MPKRRARRPSGLVVSWPRGGSRFVVCGGVEAWSPNPRLLQAAQHSSQEIFCLDNAFALIDGTKMAGQVRAWRGLLYGAGWLGLVLLTVSLRFLLSQLEERNTGAENTESKWSGREDLNLRLPACKAGKVLLSVTLLPSVSSYYQQLGVPAFAQSATPLASEHRVLIRF